MDTIDVLEAKDFSLEKEGLTKEWSKRAKKENKKYFEEKVKEKILKILEKTSGCSMRFLLFSLFSKENIYISHILLKKLLLELENEGKINMRKIGTTFVIDFLKSQ